MKFRNTFLKGLIFLIASLPFPVLYFISDVLAFVMRYIVQYRNEVIKSNLNRAFPEKSTHEIKEISARYYQNLSDLVFELIKSSKMSIDQIKNRVEFKNPELFHELFIKKKSVFASLGHCGNWEWVGNRMATFLPYESAAAIYKPIHDRFIDDYMISLRKRFKDTQMIGYKKAFRTLVGMRETPSIIYILADQSPARTEMDYFVLLFRQTTAFYNGMEKIARALDHAVVFLDIKRKKRGYYEVKAIPITENASATPEHFITKSYVNLLEKNIREQPDNWLWSHNRWKEKENYVN